jgi:glycosyltransferase involved in cell wall biosynthesis
MNKSRIDVLVVLLDINLTIDNSAVFQSQVGDQLIHLSREGFKVGIVCICNDDQVFNKVIGERLSNQGIQIFKINSKGFFKNFYNIVTMGRKILKGIEVSTFYARGIWGGLSAIQMNAFRKRKVPIVYDIRGDLKDELLSVGVSWFKQIIYLFLESICIKYSTIISAVSTKLIQVISQRYSIIESVVIPCCIDFDFFQANAVLLQQERQRLGIHPDEIVLVYSGGLSHYQQVPQMLKLWSHLLDVPNIKFLLITNEDPHSHPSTVQYKELFGSKLIHISVQRARVPLILNNADVAFLLRDDRQLNRVASPVKFAEYISCGLKVVTSPFLGDIHQQVIDHDLGIIVSPDFNDNDVLRLKNFLEKIANTRSQAERLRIKDIALRLYNWNSYNHAFTKLYKRG